MDFCNFYIMQHNILCSINSAKNALQILCWYSKKTLDEIELGQSMNWPKIIIYYIRLEILYLCKNDITYIGIYITFRNKSMYFDTNEILKKIKFMG